MTPIDPTDLLQFAGLVSELFLERWHQTHESAALHLISMLLSLQTLLECCNNISQSATMNNDNNAHFRTATLNQIGGQQPHRQPAHSLSQANDNYNHSIMQTVMNYSSDW